MKCMHGLAFKLLSILMVIGVAAAVYISVERMHVESAANTIEMVYDYDNVVENAALERVSKDDLFDLYRQSGITSLAVYDETPQKLLNHGELYIIRGTDMIYRHPDLEEVVYPDRVYLQPVPSKSGEKIFQETKNSLSLRMASNHIRVIQINGVDTIEVDADYGRFMDMHLGIYPSQVRKVTEKGFYAVLRPSNPAHPTKAVIDQFLQSADVSPKVSAVLFTGKQALGYKEQISYLSEELKKRNLPAVLIEAQTQLHFEKQEGLMDIVQGNHYDTVRLYAMSKDELSKVSQEEAASRFYISDIERNIRMNLFPSYKEPLHGETVSETNAKYISDVKERLEARGFHLGKASILAPYFPDHLMRAIVMIGALSLCCAVLLFLIPALEKWIGIIWAAGLILTQGLYWGANSVLPLQMLALGSAIGVPVLTVSLFLDYCIKRQSNGGHSWQMMMVEGTVALWTAGILSLAGACFISALLGDIRFFLEIEIFRGVKATFILPVILITFVYIQKFPFLGKPVASGAEFISFVCQVCRIPIKLGTMAGLALLAMIAFIFIGRSGNNSAAPVPDFEIQLRRFLESVMYARPREKEFLIGHPAVFLSLLALYKKWPQLIHYFLILAVTIGQGSIVETFAHMRSPFLLSFVRGLDGLAAGTAAGILALTGIVILIEITKFFGEKYGRP